MLLSLTLTSHTLLILSESKEIRRKAEINAFFSTLIHVLSGRLISLSNGGRAFFSIFESEPSHLHKQTSCCFLNLLF